MIKLSIILCAIILIPSCAHVTTETNKQSFYESGQLKDDEKEKTEKYGILFSEGKKLSIFEIN